MNNSERPTKISIGLPSQRVEAGLLPGVEEEARSLIRFCWPVRNDPRFRDTSREAILGAVRILRRRRR